MNWFDGATAVVTGAANGIGRATAEVLADLGARVLAVDVDEKALARVFGSGPVTPICADVSSGATLAQELLERFGPVTLLVNNVGIDTNHRFLQLSERDFDRVFAANLRGPWFLTRGLTQALVDARERGAIVFVSSLHDHFIRGLPHYSASKAAVAMLVKELAQELAPHGIRVNAVSPGVVRSAHVPASDERERERLQRLVPLGEIGQPRQVANMIAVLLCERWASYVTGANVPVDGGLGLYSWSTREA
jgi:NAD(P)-dependent dehydrogenase (short-subunit alcohol dehydrogenase family)